MTPRRAAVQEDSPDPADMGTAFGLDASMAEEPVARDKSRSADAAPAPHRDRLVRRPRR